MYEYDPAGNTWSTRTSLPEPRKSPVAHVFDGAIVVSGGRRAGVATTGNSLPFDLAGSTAELDFVRNILGYQTGQEPGDVSDLSASTLAPLLRGTQVMLR